jgi:hypothetical protein
LSLTTPDEATGLDQPVRRSEVEAFRSIRRRRRWFWLIFTINAPMAALALLVNERLSNVVAILWLVLSGIAGEALAWSRCPRCGELCFRKSIWHNPWATKCPFCRTRLYRTDEELLLKPDPDEAGSGARSEA